MLATFVIGLREGLEAALIVGIIAAFLRQRGQTAVLARVWLGVGLAVVVCLAAGVALQALSASLPQQQQEALETIVSLAAVAMVSYMIVWMRQHARGLRADIESAAAQALASRSAWALVAMACLAVLREGLETAVFLLAAFQASVDPMLAGLGALLGLLGAVAIGFGLYRGAVHIDLERFFRLTSVVLVLVAAGLVMTSLHTAHGAGWLNAWQQPVLNLTWLVQPGSVQAALLTGMLGLQPRPTQVETVGWLLFVVLGLAFVLWPRRASRPRTPRQPASLGSRA